MNLRFWSWARRPGLLLLLSSLSIDSALAGSKSWPQALADMALVAAPLELNRTNCVKTFLAAFKSNDVVKAMVFMPGATDELYLFRRVRVALTNTNPTLLDAVT